MYIVLVGFPIGYVMLAVLMWQNYETLKDKQSSDTKTFGYYIFNVELRETGKIVGLITSFIPTIRTYAMVGVLVFV